jgi:hypothetical protein
MKWLGFFFEYRVVIKMMLNAGEQFFYGTGLQPAP